MCFLDIIQREFYTFELLLNFGQSAFPLKKVSNILFCREKLTKMFNLKIIDCNFLQLMSSFKKPLFTLYLEV